MRSPRELRIGFSLTPPNGTSVDPQVKAVVLAAIKALEERGHRVEEHDMRLDGNAAWQTYTEYDIRADGGDVRPTGIDGRACGYA